MMKRRRGGAWRRGFAARAPRRGAQRCGTVFRWFRYASPPANLLRASGTKGRRSRHHGGLPRPAASQNSAWPTQISGDLRGGSGANVHRRKMSKLQSCLRHEAAGRQGARQAAATSGQPETGLDRDALGRPSPGLRGPAYTGAKCTNSRPTAGAVGCPEVRGEPRSGGAAERRQKPTYQSLRKIVPGFARSTPAGWSHVASRGWRGTGGNPLYLEFRLRGWAGESLR